MFLVCHRPRLTHRCMSRQNRWRHKRGLICDVSILYFIFEKVQACACRKHRQATDQLHVAEKYGVNWKKPMKVMLNIGPAPTLHPGSLTPLPQIIHTNTTGNMFLEIRSRLQRARNFSVKNVLPLGFMVALVWALSWPGPGKAVAKPEAWGYQVVKTINFMVNLIISGMTLKTDDIKKALSKEGRWGYIYGIVAILGITSCLGFAAAEIPFDVKEFSYGLAVFCIGPTTLSSGITLVANAGGNDALALLLAITTQILGVLTVPFMVQGVISAGGASVNALDLLVKLIISLLIPLGIGKVIREAVPGMKDWVKRWKLRLSLTSSAMVIMVVWQTLCGAQDELTSVGLDQILSVIAAGTSVHIIYLGINYLVCRFLLKLERRELKAVVVMSSQKSLAMSMTIIRILGAVGEEGFMIIPCIVGHMSQLFVDAYISSRWANDVYPEVDTHKIKDKALSAITEATVRDVDEGGVTFDGGIAVHTIGQQDIASIAGTEKA